jgi:2,4-didehydro-3-deoxy-L-rhamnonate hydrolase
MNEQPFALGRFSEGHETPFIGVVIDGDRVVRLDSVTGPRGTTLADLWANWDTTIERCSAWLHGKDRQLPEAASLTSLTVHAPIEPRQIICTGANYKKHVVDLVVAQGAGADTAGMTVEERRVHVTRRVEERAMTGTPYAFSKLVSAMAGPFDDIFIPRDAEQFDWELELGVVIGRPSWRVPRERALAHVAGYVIVNDLTRRELVYRSDLKGIGSDWLRSKSGPGFMPCGPLLVPRRFIPQPQDLRLELKVNGRLMQDESTADMMFDIAAQIEYVTRYVKLLPGDLLATGSPAGNGMHHGQFLQAGDVMQGSITGLGTQCNTFIAET